MTLNIKHVKLDTALLSAPFAGISNIAFRLLARKYGATLVYSEMISTRPFLIENKATMKLARYEAQEHPIIMQIVTGRPWDAYHCTLKAIELGYDGVDINCGCPARKILRSKAGGFLMTDVNYARKTFHAISKAVEDSGKSVILSAKIRTGLRENGTEGYELAKILEAEGFDIITVHARTREQLHKGEPDFNAISRIKNELSIPVIYNGGIKTASDAKIAIERTGADGIMIGQGAFGNPWLFAEVSEYLKTGKLTSYEVSIEERKATMFWHYNKLLEQFDEVIATLMFRRFATWYVRNFEGASVWRKKYQMIRSKEDFVNLTNEVFDEIK